jgi:hypothetical protein
VQGHLKEKNQKLAQEWVKNGLEIKMLMHIRGFWVLIIFHECVHKWGKYSPPSPIK